MITRAQSKSGQSIMTWNGRLVCSSVDPQAEAKKWLTKNLPKLHGKQQLLVLGVGCGYHLIELTQHKPNLRILALDFNETFIDFTKREHHLQLADIHFMNIQSIEKFKSSRVIQKMVSQAFACVGFRPAMVENLSFYNELECFALGRTMDGLYFQLEQREKFQFLKPHISENNNEKKLYSIKDLAEAIPHENHLREANLIRVLRELLV